MCARYEVLAGFGFVSVFVAGVAALVSFVPLAGAAASLDDEVESEVVAPVELFASSDLVADVPVDDPVPEVLLEAALSVL